MERRRWSGVCSPSVVFSTVGYVEWRQLRRHHWRPFDYPPRERFLPRPSSRSDTGSAPPKASLPERGKAGDWLDSQGATPNWPRKPTSTSARPQSESSVRRHPRRHHRHCSLATNEGNGASSSHSSFSGVDLVEQAGSPGRPEGSCRAELKHPGPTQEIRGCGLTLILVQGLPNHPQAPQALGNEGEPAGRIQHLQRR